MDIGEVLDKASNLRGVGCEGALNGIQFTTATGGETVGDLRITLERAAGINYLVVRDCAGVEVAKFQEV